MRRLRLRTLESGPGRVVLSLGHEAELDAKRLAALVQRSRGRYRLTPEMKLVASLDAKARSPQDLLAACKRVLKDLLTCQAERKARVDVVEPKLRR